MKKITTCVLVALLSLSAYQCKAQQAPASTTTTAAATLTQQERDYAIRLLRQTALDLEKATKNLSEAQLKYKPSADKWSVEDCAKHIAASETELWSMVEGFLKQPANPEKRAEIKVTDDALVTAVEDRSHKAKTFAALEPVNSPYKTTPEALKAFEQNRKKLIDFISTTKADLRNHVMVLPLGTYDAYQFVLLIAAHTNRHMQQMEEVKADAGFPKK